MPSMTTIAMPTCQLATAPETMSNATTAFMPSPGASASGRLATRAIAAVQTAAASAVAIATA